MKVYCTVNFKKDIENLIGLLIFRFNLNLITLAINYEIPKLRRKNKITFHGSLAENDCQLTLLKKGSHLSLLYETDAAARYGFHSANLPNNLVVTFIPSNFILYLRTLQLRWGVGLLSFCNCRRSWHYSPILLRPAPCLQYPPPLSHFED